MKNRNLIATPLAAAALLLFLTTGAVAQEVIDQTQPINPDARVSIDNISGSIVVTGWDRNEIHIEGTLGKGTERLDIKGSEKRLKIKVVLPRHKKNINIKSSHLVIHLPAGCWLDIEGISADIEVRDVTGRIEAESVSGDIVVSGRPERLAVQSVSGDLELEVQCERVDASCVSGDAILRSCICRDIEIENVSGRVRLDEVKARDIEIGTVSGKVLFDGELMEDGDISIGSQSGDIRVILPADLDAEIELGTFSGDIKSDFGPRRTPTKGFGPGEGMEFTVGNGDSQIELGTFSGDIELIKK